MRSSRTNYGIDYFELHSALPHKSQAFALCALSKELRSKLISQLQLEASAPPVSSSYTELESKLEGLDTVEIARYGFFRSERDFVQSMTGECETQKMKACALNKSPRHLRRATF